MNRDQIKFLAGWLTIFGTFIGSHCREYFQLRADKADLIQQVATRDYVLDEITSQPEVLIVGPKGLSSVDDAARENPHACIFAVQRGGVRIGEIDKMAPDEVLYFKKVVVWNKHREGPAMVSDCLVSRGVAIVGNQAIKNMDAIHIPE